MTKTTTEQIPYIKILNTIIGLAIMLVGPLLNSPEFSFPATPRLEELGMPIVDGDAIFTFSSAGWTASIIFLGLIWLWLTVDTFWPSLVAIALMGLNPEYQLATVIAQYFGHPITFLTFFLLFFIAAMVNTKFMNYVANYMLTRDFLQGRPWLLVTMLYFASYIAALIDNMSTPFILWPIIYLILNEIGCKPGDKLSIFLIGNVIGGVVLSFTTDVIKGGPFFATTGLNVYIAQNPQLGLEPVNMLNWFFMAFITSIVGILVTVFCMRFIFRVDVEPLRNFDMQKLKKNPLPPMNWKQKTIVVLFITYVLLMLVPNILPASLPIGGYLKSRTMISSFIIFILMITIRYKKEPLVKVNEVSAGISWGLFFLLSSTYYFGSILSAPSTNIPLFLELLVTNSLQGLGYWAFLAFTIMMGLVVTNILNTIVCAIVLAPIVASIAISYGFTVMPIVVLFIYAVLLAILTPGSGLGGAMLYGNKEWMPGNSSAIYATSFTIIMTIVTFIVALPLAQLLF